MKYVLFALAFLGLPLAASAQTYSVQTQTFCEACAADGVALNFESSEVTVNVNAAVLQFNPESGLFEGPGLIEVLGRGPDGAFPVLVRDVLARFAVSFVPVDGLLECSARSIASIRVEGIAEGAGNRFVLTGDGSLLPPAGFPCAMTKVRATISIDKGNGFVKRSAKR